MQDTPHIHFIGIGGIGISALARYYLSLGYHITGTNDSKSILIETLSGEGINIVQNGEIVITQNTQKVIYTEAIIDDESLGLDGVHTQHKSEIIAAQKYNCEIVSYPEALGEICNAFPLKIAVAGAHGKSTTSSMLGTILQNTGAQATTITGTLLTSFGGKNIHIGGTEIINIEACEYRNAFLRYKPDIAIVTNVDPDHLDFFKTAAAYREAFHHFARQSSCLVIPRDEAIKNDLLDITPTTVLVSENYFEIQGRDFRGIKVGKYTYTLPKLLVPGDHIRLDASLAYITSQLIGIDATNASNALAHYPGSWRRMETVCVTGSGNILMSDYGHHPTEIIATLSALKKAHPEKKIIVFFEPHQYSRTYELRDEFAISFLDTSMTYLADIYAARDIDEKRDMISSEMLASLIAGNSPCIFVGDLTKMGKKLKQVDQEEKNSLIILLGAGNIDTLRDIIGGAIEK